MKAPRDTPRKQCIAWLASVVLALGVYQLLLAAVAYGWIRLPFLASAPASWVHRASGDTIVLLTVAVALMCVGYYGFDFGDDGGTHAIVAVVPDRVAVTSVTGSGVAIEQAPVVTVAAWPGSSPSSRHSLYRPESSCNIDGSAGLSAEYWTRSALIDR